VAYVPDLATSTPVRVCHQVESHLEDAFMCEPLFRDDLIVYVCASPKTCSRRLEERDSQHS
jgi:DNA-binding transcriptional LysR family regulator